MFSASFQKTWLANLLAWMQNINLDLTIIDNLQLPKSNSNDNN